MSKQTCPWNGKEKHASAQAAREHQARLRDRRGVALEVYRCERCEGYHVGRPSQKNVRSNAAVHRSEVKFRVRGRGR